MQIGTGMSGTGEQKRIVSAPWIHCETCIASGRQTASETSQNGSGQGKNSTASTETASRSSGLKMTPSRLLSKIILLPWILLVAAFCGCIVLIGYGIALVEDWIGRDIEREHAREEKNWENSGKSRADYYGDDQKG